MKLNDFIDKENERFNSSLAQNNDNVKILSVKDIDDIVKFYKAINSELRGHGEEKFLHAIGYDEAENLIKNDKASFLGYYRDKKLAGTIYTRPFEKNDPYFQTPAFDKDGVSYDFGGFAVKPEYRGQRIISKLANIVYNGVKDFSQKAHDENISGMGIEISTENFKCLAATSAIKSNDGKPLVNFAGYHYINDENLIDNDATLLGYSSFNTRANDSYISLPKIVMDGVQEDCFNNLVKCTNEIGDIGNGYTVDCVGEHNIVTLNTYFNNPLKEALILERPEEQ